MSTSSSLRCWLGAFVLVAACGSGTTETADAAAGGARGSGGATASGGTSVTGATTTLGGSVATGGVSATGGASSAGGAIGTGGGTAAQDARSASDGSSDAAGACAYGPQNEALDLSCTGLYSDWATKTVPADVHAYDPGLHLWSDGADKQRWIRLPPGTQIDTSNMDEWSFPTGTKVWKEFSLAGKRVETRLLWKATDAAWYLTTYRWSADESTAPELTTGALNVDGHGFEIPTQEACSTCHNGRQDEVLGFEAVALSSPLATGFAMSALVSGHWLTAPPSAPLVIPGSATTATALGYLHINCGTSCHNRGTGIASKTGFFTRLEVSQLARGDVHATDTWLTGVKVVGNYPIPVAGDAGDPTLYRLDPNDAAASSVYYRMDHRDADDALVSVQMPPLATHSVDATGVAAIAAWINAGCE